MNVRIITQRDDYLSQFGGINVNHLHSINCDYANSTNKRYGQKIFFLAFGHILRIFFV